MSSACDTPVVDTMIADRSPCQLSVDPKIETIALLVVTRWVGSKRVRSGIGRRIKADVLFLKELIEAGEFRAVVDRRYPMDQAAEAHRYVEAWHKAGNVVLTIAADS